MARFATIVFVMSVLGCSNLVSSRYGFWDGGEHPVFDGPSSADSGLRMVVRTKRSSDGPQSGAQCLNLASNRSVPLPEDEEAFAFGDAIVPGWAVFYQTNLSLAFVKPKNVVPGHVLVMPLSASKRLLDMPAEELADMFLTAQHVQRGMERIHGVSSSLIAVQDGPDAGQSVDHVHVHIMPRRPKDFEENDEIYFKLQKMGTRLPMKYRTKEEMTAEAKELRELFAYL